MENCDHEAMMRCCVHRHDTLRAAMLAIQRSSSGMALLVDPDATLLGVISDGDIRRALLGGATIDDSVKAYAKTQCKTVGPEASRAAVLDYMQSLQVQQVPVVDKNGRLVGLHLLHDILGHHRLPNQAVILAGGRGTRLGNLTKQVPKPMLKVAGRPILERLVLHLAGCGIKTIFISVGYLANVIEDHFNDGSTFGCKIEYLREAEPLGTGGPLVVLRDRVDAPLVVCNGDLVTQVNIPSMLQFHRSGGYKATIGFKTYVHEVPFGCLSLDDAGCVKVIEEKPTWAGSVNAGIYVVDPELVKRIPQKFFPITELFRDSLSRSEKIGAFEIDDDWVDVGNRESLKQARSGM